MKTHNSISTSEKEKDPKIPANYKPTNLLNSQGKIAKHVIMNRPSSYLINHGINFTDQSTLPYY